MPMMHKCAQLEETFRKGYSGLPRDCVNPPEQWINWVEPEAALLEANPKTRWAGPMLRINPKGLHVEISFCPFCGEDLLSQLSPLSVSRISKSI